MFKAKGVCKTYTGKYARAGNGDNNKIFFKTSGNIYIGTNAPEAILSIWLIAFLTPSASGE